MNSVPNELASTVSLLVKAYPKGIPDDEYKAVIFLLYNYMSDRNLALTVAHVTGKDYMGVYNDIAGVCEVEPDLSSITRARLRLAEAGYDSWTREE